MKLNSWKSSLSVPERRADVGPVTVEASAMPLFGGSHPQHGAQKQTQVKAGEREGFRREVGLWLNAVFVLTDSVRGVGLGNLRCIGEVQEPLHFAVLNRPNMHQRKVKTLTRSGHRCTISTYHDHFVVLCDEFVGP
jgi:hypothetical protein